MVKKIGTSLSGDMLPIPLFALTLENGQVVKFDLRKEVSTPDDSDSVVEEAKRSSGKLMFWRYQCERSRKKLREIERLLKKREAVRAVMWRRYIDEETQSSSGDFGVVDNYLNADEDKELARLRSVVSALKHEVGVIESVCTALEQRGFIVTRLLGTAR